MRTRPWASLRRWAVDGLATTVEEWCTVLRKREERVAWLRRVPLFADLSTSQLNALTPLVEEIDALPGQVLMREGEHGRELLIVIDGHLDASREGEHLRDMGPGSVIGEISLLDGGRRTATVTAREPSRLLTIGKPAFDTVLDKVPGLPHELLRAMAVRLRDATEHPPPN